MAPALTLAGFSLTGGAIAGLYTALLAWNVRLHRDAAVGRAMVVHVGRIAIVVAVLVALARAGSRPFLFSVLGFAAVHGTVVAVAIQRRATWSRP